MLSCQNGHGELVRLLIIVIATLLRICWTKNANYVYLYVSVPSAENVSGIWFGLAAVVLSEKKKRAKIIESYIRQLKIVCLTNGFSLRIFLNRIHFFIISLCISSPFVPHDVSLRVVIVIRRANFSSFSQTFF